MAINAVIPDIVALLQDDSFDHRAVTWSEDPSLSKTGHGLFER
jgi:hypothetical protein